jgi:hypothetical protein
LRKRVIPAGKTLCSSCRRSEPLGKTALYIRPVNCARTPEELIEKVPNLERVLAGGYLDPATMKFTILEVEPGDAVELNYSWQAG